MNKIHPTADISETAIIGEDTYIWHQCQIRENTVIGNGCSLGKNVYIDHDTQIGDKCKIQNNASIYYKAILEEGVFVGPNVVLTNDLLPRAIKADGSPRGMDDVSVTTTTLKRGCSIGAGSVILPGVTIGEFAMVGAGSVVTKDIPPFTLYFGNPAKFIRKIDEKGEAVS